MLQKITLDSVSGLVLCGVAGYIEVETAKALFLVNCLNAGKVLLTNPQRTTEGLTVGESNRATLHKELDAFLDGWLV